MAAVKPPRKPKDEQFLLVNGEAVTIYRMKGLAFARAMDAAEKLESGYVEVSREADTPKIETDRWRFERGGDIYPTVIAGKPVV